MVFIEAVSLYLDFSITKVLNLNCNPPKNIKHINRTSYLLNKPYEAKLCLLTFLKLRLIVALIMSSYFNFVSPKTILIIIIVSNR